MARAAAMCLVLGWACLGARVRLLESHGESEGLAVTKKELHGVTGATPNSPTICEKNSPQKRWKSYWQGFSEFAKPCSPIATTRVPGSEPESARILQR